MVEGSCQNVLQCNFVNTKMLRSLDLLEVIKRIKRSAGDYSDQDSRTGGGTSAAH